MQPPVRFHPDETFDMVPLVPLARRGRLVQALRPVLIACGVAAQLSASDELPRMTYRLSAQPRDGLAELVVDASAEFTPGEEVVMTLPEDRVFGSPVSFLEVVSIEGADGAPLEEAEGRTRKCVAGEDGLVSVRYRMRFDPARIGASTYAPNAGPDHVHAMGSQWRLEIGDPDREYSIEVSWDSVPDGWVTYGSMPDAADGDVWRQSGAQSSLNLRVFGAGDLFTNRMKTDQGPLDVHVWQGFEAGAAEIAAAIGSIALTQREYFPEDEIGSFVIVVLPRAENLAGLAVGGSFLCYLDPGSALDRISMLVSHETFHTWLPGRFRVGSKDDFLRYQWLYEGVNDYVARCIARDSGAISESEFARLVNLDLRNLSDNPHRLATLDELEQAQEEGRFGQEFTKLSYYRGALIALNWDAELARSGADQGLVSLITGIIRSAAAEDGVMTEQQFAEALAEHGLDVGSVLERYVVYGEPVEPAADALGERYVRRRVLRPSYEAGFDLRRSYREGAITGLVPDSLAERAGLREGLAFRYARNGTRFGNAWDPERPLEVVIGRDGDERTLAYFPEGDAQEVWMFLPR